LQWSADGIAVWESAGLVAIAGNNMFKHAPVLGRALAQAALGEGLPPALQPQAKLGAERLGTTAL
jgi:sarcosine oxidase